ncbi:MAG: hypothetical protein LBV27_05355 [Oscillospiraceae bacterium]|nr:hypothetical protein [Oscillospiraceae bacterium]
MLTAILVMVLIVTAIILLSVFGLMGSFIKIVFKLCRFLFDCIGWVLRLIIKPVIFLALLAVLIVIFIL